MTTVPRIGNTDSGITAIAQMAAKVSHPICKRVCRDCDLSYLAPRAVSGSSHGTDIMKPVVFIHTNDQQMVAAKLCEHSLRARSKRPDAFEVRMLRVEETPQLYPHREGRPFLHSGYVRTWRNRDLQTHDPLRMRAPQLMRYEGRALMLDPDVLAIGDVNDLLTRDMQHHAILCRARPNQRPSTAVMLLDCARLKHWRWEEALEEVFALRLDLLEWQHLAGDEPETIGALENEWNDLDHLDAHTKLLHLSRQITQPWKTGLPIDFDLDAWGAYPYRQGFHLRNAIRRIGARLRSPQPGAKGVYQKHPDARLEEFFFALMKEAIDRGAISEAFVADEIRKGYLRADAFEMLARCDTRTASGQSR